MHHRWIALLLALVACAEAPDPPAAPALPTTFAEALAGLDPGQPWPAEIELADGLRIELARQGLGPPCAARDYVTLLYSGYLAADMRLFEGPRETTFTLGKGSVIPALDRSVEGMCVGTVATLHIPSELAYGRRGGAGIPEDADMVFEIEIRGVR